MTDRGNSGINRNRAIFYFILGERVTRNSPLEVGKLKPTYAEGAGTALADEDVEVPTAIFGRA